MKLIVDNIIYSIHEWKGVSDNRSELRNGLLNDNSIDFSELEVITKTVSKNFKAALNNKKVKIIKFSITYLDGCQNTLRFSLDEIRKIQLNFTKISTNGN